MTNRLQQICCMIPKDGIGFADIGTDHGIIPVWLAENGYQGYLFASDIAEEPLKKAMQLAQMRQVEKRIHFSLSNGLEFCPLDLIDCILIAGLGGDSICRILDRADWIFERKRTLLFQPMTHAEVVRYWLIHNEFQITREVTVSEDGHLYQIFSAELGPSRSVTDLEYLIGCKETPREGESLDTVLQNIYPKLVKKVEGISASRVQNTASYRFYQNILRQLETQLNQSKTE